MSPERILYLTFLFSITYFVVQAFYYLFFGLIGLTQSRIKSLQLREEDKEILSTSYFTIPVTFLVPARNEEVWIENSIKSILNLDYPEFEIIIVNDGSTDKTLEVLDSFLALESLDKEYVDQFKQGKIYGVYKSKKYNNVTVINKEGGFKKAGALNAGLNFARYKYICAIDADTILEPDALIKVMTQIDKDPDRIIGVGSYFGLVNGFKVRDGKILEKSFSYNPIFAFQNLEYIRSFMSIRLSWSEFNAMPCVAGGFGVWRRDLIMQLRGYSTDFSSEDMAFTFQAHDYMVKNQKDYQILMLPYYVGWTNGPSTIPALIQQRNRWQRVTNEAVWRYRYMFLNPKYKWLAVFTYPYLLVYEVFGVFVEIFSIAMLTWAWFIHILDLKIYLSYLFFLVMVQAFISLSVIFAFIRDQQIFRFRYTCYLILLSFLELFAYRWIIAVARIRGIFGSIRGVRDFDQFKRQQNLV